MKKIFTLIISLQMIASSVFAQQTPTAETDDITIGKQEIWQGKRNCSFWIFIRIY